MNKRRTELFVILRLVAALSSFFAIIAAAAYGKEHSNALRLPGVPQEISAAPSEHSGFIDLRARRATGRKV